MSKPRRIVPATELRIHLGEALKGLEDEDIVIVKGGVPVAMLTRYGKERAAMIETIETQYERALSKRAEPGGWARSAGAMERGWVGINEEELIANIYRWRDEGATRIRYELDETLEGEDQPHAGEILDRQRRMHQGYWQGALIADERAEYDASGGPRD